jgi:glycine oxidase
MAGNRFDTLIVGQGLAGSALAWQLHARGQRVCIVDDSHATASSQVAAGLINPLAGLRYSHRPGTLAWLESAERWYAELGQRFDRAFHVPLPMLRLLRSPEQRRFHERAAADPANATLLAGGIEHDRLPHGLHAPHGGFLQSRTGHVDLPALLTHLGTWLTEHAETVRAIVDPAAIDAGGDGVRWRGIRAGRLVFCDGARLRDNPWFSGLPLQPEKGEILDLDVPGLDLDVIINGAHWVIPLGPGRVRFGATHEHAQIDLKATPAGREALLAGFRTLFPAMDAVTVASHRAGIRPATTDRAPLLGAAARAPRIYVCNGFGARGALSIPWYAERLADHLCDGIPLPAEADIQRFA